MRRIRRIATLLLAALALTGAGARAASTRDAVLGADGDLYTVTAGTYGQLFPGGKDAATASSVLALDIVKADGARTRLLVKGTEGEDADESPFLLYEESSRTLFLVWETRLGGVFPILMLTGYDGSWMAPFPIIDYPFSIKTSPQLAVTHDNYQEESAAGSVTHHWTVLHLVWGQEADTSGEVDTYYAPLYFEDGALIGRSPSYRLNGFVDADAAGLADSGSPLAGHIARIQRGRDDRTVMVAFSGEGNRRLSTLEIGALPPQLGRIADGARAHIIDLGTRFFPNNIPSLAGAARSDVLRLGTSFDPEVLKTLADQVELYVVAKAAVPGATLKLIADGARAHIIDLGAKLSGRGLRTAQSDSAASRIVEVKGSALGAGSDDDVPSQLLQFCEVSSRALPDAARTEVRLFFSETGERVILAWASGNRVLYRESLGSGWRDLLEIRLSDTLDEARAFEILEQRVHNR